MKRLHRQIGLTIAALFLTACKFTYVDMQPKGFIHALLHGNPNKREWGCHGPCPPEVRALERAEDERHKAHSHTVVLF